METGRKKRPVSLAVDPALLERLDRWINSQEAPWTKIAIFELALKEFLEKRGENAESMQ